MDHVNLPNGSDDRRVGGRLGKYQITQRLGQGGMGVVYEAEDTVLKRRVAIKLLSDEPGAESEPLRRLLHEAQAAARLNHPNVVTVHEVNRRDGVHFIAMELVDGGSAQDFLETMGPFNWLEATRVIADACRGLVAAHAAGLIHRDIKPANIMRSGDGVVKLADFGLAKITDRPGVSISGPGTLVGTPHYMSPEQCRFDPIDDLSDIYSLGATYFALLTGKPPYPGDLQVQVMYAHCSSPVPDPRELDQRIPEKVAAVARKAMAKRPEERFRSAADMLAALDAILASVAKSRRAQPSQWSLAMKAHRDHLPRDNAKATHGPPRKVRRELVAAAVVMLIAFCTGLGFLVRSMKQPVTVESAEPKPDPWDDLDEILAGLDAKPADGATTEASEEGKPSISSESQRSSLLTSLGDAIPLPGVATALGVSVKDSRVAIACQPGTGHDIVCLWDSQTGKLTPISTADIPFGVAGQNANQPRRVRALAFHIRTGQLIAAIHNGEAAGVAALSLGPTPRWETWFPLPAHQVGALAMSRDGVRVAAAIRKAAGQSDSVAVWNGQEQKLIDEVTDVTAVTALAFSPSSSRTLAIGESTGTVTVVDHAAKTSQSFETGTGVRALSFASGGNFLGVAGGSKLAIYSLGRKQAMSFPTQGDAHSLALFPGGTYLIAGSETGGRGSIEVFRMPNPKRVERLDAHDGPIAFAAFTSDGTLLTTGRDQTLRQWQLNSSGSAGATAEQANREQR